MSRSRRKTPVIGIAKACSEKCDKRCANRTLRKRMKERLRRNTEVLPVLREVSDAWHFNKEAKIRFDPRKSPELLRK
jgi:hypothetical protein